LVSSSCNISPSLIVFVGRIVHKSNDAALDHLSPRHDTRLRDVFSVGQAIKGHLGQPQGEVEASMALEKLGDRFDSLANAVADHQQEEAASLQVARNRVDEVSLFEALRTSGPLP
jgi:hypothetical protein